MKDINISVRFKKYGLLTRCYVLIERKNVPVINEVIDLLTTRLFTKCIKKVRENFRISDMLE